MTPDYWLQRWQAGQIGFHRADVNPQLVAHHRFLGESLRLLVPLCGKSHDLEWLAVQGHEVVGLELSQQAAEAFFSERGFTPERRTVGDFIEYEYGAVKIVVGDFFAASAETLGYFDGAYDRAAMIALPQDLRARYVAQLRALLGPKSKLLLVTLYYDAVGGPPFSVSAQEINAVYAGARISQLASTDARADAPGPVQRGASFVHEDVYAISLSEG